MAKLTRKQLEEINEKYTKLYEINKNFTPSTVFFPILIGIILVVIKAIGISISFTTIWYIVGGVFLLMLLLLYTTIYEYTALLGDFVKYTNNILEENKEPNNTTSEKHILYKYIIKTNININK